MAEGQGNIVLGGDAVGNVIVAGSGNTVTLDVGGIGGDLLNLLTRPPPTKQLRIMPLSVRPPPFPDHLDRDEEAEAILRAAAPGAPVNVYGEEGIGKTYLLTSAASRPGADAARDGVVHLDGREGRRQDLLQQLFEELFECRPPLVQSEAENRRDLRDKELLVFVDSFELERDEAQRLFASAPRCRFIVASVNRTVWEGTPLRLRGLAPADALALVQREMGPLTGAERSAAEAMCAALDHNPLAVRQAASTARDEQIPLAELAAWLDGAPSGRAGHLDATLGAATREEREILSTLAVFGSAPVGTEHLDAILDLRDVAGPLDSLQRRGIVVAHSPRYSLAGVTAAEVESRWGADVESKVERATAHYLRWAAARRRDLPGLMVQSGALLALLRAADRRGRPDHVIALGRALSAPLAWSRRWGQWQEVLESVLAAARRSDDRPGEAWALHQLGTRLVALGDVADGVSLLREALDIRERSLDRTGTETTRHNLEVARRLGAPPTRGGIPTFRLWMAILVLGLASLAGGAYLAAPSDAATLAVTSQGGGTVTSSRGGIDCRTSCKARFRPGTPVTLIATAPRGMVFGGWEGAGCTGSGPCTTMVRDDASVTARFQPMPNARLLTVRVTGGGGTVTSVPSGIDCGRSCTASFADGGLVTLSAAADGTVFAGWRGPGCAALAPCTLTLRSDVTIEAVFQAAGATSALTVQTGGGPGTVTSTPSGILCGASCRGNFAAGTTVTLLAAPDPGAEFTGWRGGGCTGTGTCTVNLGQDTTLEATFKLAAGTTSSTATTATTVTPVPTYVLGVQKQGKGRVVGTPAIDCGSSCRAPLGSGTTVTLTATPDKGSRFAGWQGGGCSGTGHCTVTMTKDQSVTAVFEMPTLTVEVNGPGSVTTSTSGEVTCSTSCKYDFPEGTIVTLRANSGQAYFVAWAGACTGGFPECVLTLSQDMTVSAQFVNINDAPA